MDRTTLITLFRSRATVVWGCFVVATIASWWLGTHGSSSDAAAVAVLGIGCLKGCFVGLDFMELRHAPTWLRATFGSWILIVFLMLSGLFLAA